MGVNLKLLKEFKLICEEQNIPFTFQAFDTFVSHISK